MQIAYFVPPEFKFLQFRVSPEGLDLLDLILHQIQLKQVRDIDWHQLTNFIQTQIESAKGLPSLFDIESLEVLDVVLLCIEGDKIGKGRY